MKFGDKLIVLRKKNGLSQEELAEKLGVSRQSVSKWESNNTYPETDKIVQICNLFDCSMDDLINDKVTDVEGALRKNKNNLNEVWDSLLEFITKTINMFSHMKFSTGLKCVIEMAIIAFLLWLVGLGVCGITSSIIANLFEFLGTKASSIIENVLDSVFNILWFVIAVIALVHTFKIRYLNYYEEPEKEEKSNKKDSNKKTEIKTSERVIIRDEKDKPFAFLSVLSKIVLFFIKFIVFWIAFGTVFAVVGLVTASIISLSYIPTHALFVGSTLSLIAASVIAILFLLLCIYFIISKKVNVKVFVITFISSVIIFGAGIGIFALAIKNIDIIDNTNSDTLASQKLTLEVEDNLVILNQRLEENTYIIDESIPEDTIEIEVTYDKEIDTVVPLKTENHSMTIYVPHTTHAISTSEYLKLIVKDLKNNKLYINRFDSNIYSLTIKANSNNINKLIENTEKLYLVEKEDKDGKIIVKLHGIKTRVSGGNGLVHYDARTGELVYAENLPTGFECYRSVRNTSYGEIIDYSCSSKEERAYYNYTEDDYDEEDYE